ncbi:MAG: hypothetical protein B6D64_02630 [Bacteroidetes bacterium 4484_276]|nr:MAG: hypothetical protein B6D64_02630 [Bacteroidetes bacterium 4484_276]
MRFRVSLLRFASAGRQVSGFRFQEAETWKVWPAKMLVPLQKIKCLIGMKPSRSFIGRFRV